MKKLSKKLVSLLIVFVYILLPSFAFAQVECYPVVENIGDMLCKVANIIDTILPILLALGVLYFVWGIVMYVIADEESAKQKGKDRMIFGIIGLVVIVSMWGLVSLVVETFGVEQQGNSLVQNFIDYNRAITGSGEEGCDISAGFSGSTFGDLVKYATCIITESIIPLILALAMATFIWGVVQYVINDSDGEKKARGRDFMIWGIIGLTVMVGVWGLVRIFGGTFGIQNVIPQLP